MTTDGGSKRKLSDRTDPGASIGCYIEQGFPADAIQTICRPGERPTGRDAAGRGAGQRFQPAVSLAGTPTCKPGGSGPIQRRPGLRPGLSMSSGVLEGAPDTRSNSLHHT